MGDKDRHVVKSPDGGWDVKAPNADRASSHHDTQAQAEQRAKEIVGNAGGRTTSRTVMRSLQPGPGEGG